MKKLSYLLGLLVVTGIIFTSCSKDDDEPTDVKPTINFKGGGDYVSGDVTVDVNDTLLIGVTATQNSNTTKKLQEIYISRTSENNIVWDTTMEINETFYDADFNFIALSIPTVETIAFRVSDKDGEVSSVSLDVTTEPNTTPLEGAQALEWIRDSGAAGTGLDMFGLKWTSNAKDIFAVIQKNDADPADLFVQLTADEWTSITTKEDLAAAVDAATEIDTYEEVNLTVPSSDYDDVLATKYNGEYFIIHIQELTAVQNGVDFIFTISGEYNK